MDRQPVSHQIIGPKYLTKSCLQPKQSELDQDDVKIVVQKIPGNFCIECVTKRLNITDRKEVYGSIDQNLPDSCLESELNIMHRERRGIQVIQHNTNTITSGEKPTIKPTIANVQPSVESSYYGLVIHKEIMTASIDNGSHIYGLGIGWDPCAPSPSDRVFK